jgi:hypothetical protein
LQTSAPGNDYLNTLCSFLENDGARCVSYIGGPTESLTFKNEKTGLVVNVHYDPLKPEKAQVLAQVPGKRDRKCPLVDYIKEKLNERVDQLLQAEKLKAEKTKQQSAKFLKENPNYV